MEGKYISAELLIDKKSWDPRWHEFIIFLAGELNHPKRLLEILSDKTKYDILYQLLSLAVRCTAELKTLQISQENTGQYGELLYIVNPIITDSFIILSIPIPNWHSAHIFASLKRIERTLLANSAVLSEAAQEKSLHYVLIQSFKENRGKFAVENCGVAGLSKVFLLDEDKEQEKYETQVLRQMKKMMTERGITPSELLRTGNTRIRRWAVKFLGEFGNKDDISILRKCLYDKNAFIRRLAVEFLAKQGEEDIIDDLIIALQDEDWIVSNYAMEMLRKMKNVSFNSLATALQKNASRGIIEFASVCMSHGIYVFLDIQHSEGVAKDVKSHSICNHLSPLVLQEILNANEFMKQFRPKPIHQRRRIKPEWWLAYQNMLCGKAPCCQFFLEKMIDLARI